MYSIRKKFRCEYAHQLIDSYSKDCQTMHGHSAVIEVSLSSKELLVDGMIIDFGHLKAYVNDIIQSFDHALILWDEMDTEYINMLKQYNKDIMLVGYNPTAENMSRDICMQIRSALNEKWEFADQVKLAVKFHETETGYAEYSEDLS